MGSYWQRRRARADARLGRAERDVARRAEAYYREELKGLEKEIAAFYAEFPEGHVEAYKAAFKKLSADEERTLWEDCDRFAAEHPDRAWMVPVRKGMYRLTRSEGLQQSARLRLAEATAKAESLLPHHFEEAAREAARAVTDTLGFNTYDDGAVRRFVGTKWADGKSFSDRIWDNTAKLAEYVCGDMAKALARGDSYARLRDEIARRFVSQSVSNIMRVVQTEGTYVSRQVQGDEMRRAGFDAYHIDSVGDKRTCDTCRAVSRLSHERPFRFEDAKPGENYPPLHPRCRCEVNPAVDDWADFIKGGDGRPQDRARVAGRFGADMLRTLADPAVEYYGSAEEDDPKRLKEIIVDLETNGIKIIRHGRNFESIGYSPCSAGRPGTGQMHVTEGMSLLAWEHEYDHFLRDKEHGYPGTMKSMYDLAYRTDAEKRAYSREIEIALRRGDNDLVERLESLLSAELERLGEVIQHVVW